MSSLLFIDENNACQSQFAEAFARLKAPANLNIVSAGLSRTQVCQSAIEVMREIGIDISAQSAKTIREVDKQTFAVAIVLGGGSPEECPVLPGNPAVINWNLPKNNGQEKDIAFFRELRDRIKQEVDNFFDNGYFSAFISARTDSQLVLDNISDAIIAHDMNRNIYYFNKAAEKLTGYKREDVLDSDCHVAFGSPLCGEKCLFCSADGKNEVPDRSCRTLQLTNKKGKKLICEMTTTLIRDNQDYIKGILAVVRDLSVEQNLSKFAVGAERFHGIIGTSPEMQEVLDSISDISHSRAPVMICGESGTGKELAARAIHQQSPRKNKLFVPINCGALPENLLESELFGHVKGAFTGAIRDKKGRFEIADGGTIFLDEIGDISPAMQVKLLRVLQEGTFEKVGGEKTLKADVRIISATNKDLTLEMAEGRFREDLFYRLNVVPLNLPPLRERGSDVIILSEYLLSNAAKEVGRGRIHFSAPVIDAFLAYDWPGNIRELQNWIQYAVLKSKGDVIEMIHLPARSSLERVNIETNPPKKTRKRKLSHSKVQDALIQTGGNKQKAAKLLGVGRATLYRFLETGEQVSH